MKAVGLKNSPKKGKGRVAAIWASQGSPMSISQGQGPTTPISSSNPNTPTSNPNTPTSRPPRPASSSKGNSKASVRRRKRTTFDFQTSIFADQFPPYIVPYIDQCTNVTGDGHCGFRAVALAIYGTEDEWIRVRNDLVNDL